MKTYEVYGYGINKIIKGSTSIVIGRGKTINGKTPMDAMRRNGIRFTRYVPETEPMPGRWVAVHRVRYLEDGSVYRSARDRFRFYEV